MPSRLIEQLTRDHVAIPRMLDRCLLPSGAVDLRRFDEFRRFALRHVMIEERVLMPLLERRLGRAPAFQNAMRKDHEAIAALCVPTPDPEWIGDLRELMTYHNQVEEQPGGFYALFDQHLAAEEKAVEAAFAALPALVLPPLQRGPQVGELLREVLRQLGLAEPLPGADA